jgi:hypothetical protein
LTSLYAVIKGPKVLRADFTSETIQIAFNPLTERFDVTDAAIRKDRGYIPDITEIWRTGTKLIPFANKLVKDLGETRNISEEDVEKIHDSVSRLYNLPQYTFVVLEMVSSIGIETIAEIFVRINGEGNKLNQSDFIMTLCRYSGTRGAPNLRHSPSRLAFPPMTSLGHVRQCGVIFRCS